MKWLTFLLRWRQLVPSEIKPGVLGISSGLSRWGSTYLSILELTFMSWIGSPLESVGLLIIFFSPRGKTQFQMPFLLLFAALSVSTCFLLWFQVFYVSIIKNTQTVIWVMWCVFMLLSFTRFTWLFWVSFCCFLCGLEECRTHVNEGKERNFALSYFLSCVILAMWRHSTYVQRENTSTAWLRRVERLGLSIVVGCLNHMTGVMSEIFCWAVSFFVAMRASGVTRL